MTAADPCATVVDVSTVARPLDPNIIEISAGFQMWHVGHPQVPFASFDTRSDTDYRFSPLTRHGAIVGTLYAAETKAAAIAETLWRGLPLNGALLPFDRVADRPVGVFTNMRPLRLVELHDPGLRKLGLRSTDLTDTSPMCYPPTRAYGQVLLADHPDVDGFVWMSSRLSRDKAYLLIDRDPRQIAVGAHALFSDPVERDHLITVSDAAGIAVTLPVDGI